MPVNRRWMIDGAIAVAVTAALVAERVITPSTTLQPAAALGLSVVIGGSLVLRHRAPLAGYLVGSLAMIAESLLGTPSALAPYANLVGLFSLGIHGSRRHALAGPVILVPGVLAYFLAAGESIGVVAASVVFVWVSAWAIGFQSARGREQQEVARRATEREAVAAERLRIARELHDVVGHTVNLMLVQTGATRLVLDSDPQKARELLGGVETAGREALGELDELLGLLREDAPQPGIAHLPALAERFARAGLDVRLETTDLALPAQVDATAFRIVQEALTNAVRHGGAASAVVRVHAGPEVVVQVTDDGRGAQGHVAGRGLLGMTERAELLGGSLEHGGVAGGFRVTARLGPR